MEIMKDKRFYYHFSYKYIFIFHEEIYLFTFLIIHDMMKHRFQEVVLKIFLCLVCLFFSLSVKAGEKIQTTHQLLNITTTLDTPHDIALTLDACGGKTDWRILQLLVQRHIPSTIFVTEKWIKQNPQAVEYLKNHTDIFQIENHGKEHKEAVFQEMGAYHLPATRDLIGLKKEVLEGKLAIEQAFGVSPTWYRDAGALYDNQSVNWIKQQGFKLGGYSIAADEGATANTSRILFLLNQAKAGDVLLMHVNKPQGHTFDGLSQGLPLLQEKGLHFVWLPKD